MFPSYLPEEDRILGLKGIELQRTIFNGSFLRFIIDNYVVVETLQGFLRH